MSSLAGHVYVLLPRQRPFGGKEEEEDEEVDACWNEEEEEDQQQHAVAAWELHSHSQLNKNRLQR